MASETEELIELGDLDPDAWYDYAEAQGWSDGFPVGVDLSTSQWCSQAYGRYRIRTTTCTARSRPRIRAPI